MQHSGISIPFAVVRDVDAIYGSLIKSRGFSPTRSILLDMLNCIESLGCVVVSYEELEDMAVLESLWLKLDIGDFDARKTSEILRMHVQCFEDFRAFVG